MKVEKHNEVKLILKLNHLITYVLRKLKTYYHYTLLIILPMNEQFDHVLNHQPLLS